MSESKSAKSKKRTRSTKGGESAPKRVKTGVSTHQKKAATSGKEAKAAPAAGASNAPVKANCSVCRQMAYNVPNDGSTRTLAWVSFNKKKALCTGCGAGSNRVHLPFKCTICDIQQNVHGGGYWFGKGRFQICTACVSSPTARLDRAPPAAPVAAPSAGAGSSSSAPASAPASAVEEKKHKPAFPVLGKFEIKLSSESCSVPGCSALAVEGLDLCSGCITTARLMSDKDLTCCNCNKDIYIWDNTFRYRLISFTDCDTGLSTSRSFCEPCFSGFHSAAAVAEAEIDAHEEAEAKAVEDFEDSSAELESPTFDFDNPPASPAGPKPAAAAATAVDSDNDNDEAMPAAKEEKKLPIWSTTDKCIVCAKPAVDGIFFCAACAIQDISAPDKFPICFLCKTRIDCLHHNKIYRAADPADDLCFAYHPACVDKLKQQQAR